MCVNVGETAEVSFPFSACFLSVVCLVQICVLISDASSSSRVSDLVLSSSAKAVAYIGHILPPSSDGGRFLKPILTAWYICIVEHRDCSVVVVFIIIVESVSVLSTPCSSPSIEHYLTMVIVIQFTSAL